MSAVKPVLYWSFFLLASVAIHLFVIWGPRRLPSTQQVSDLVKKVDLQLAAVQPPPASAAAAAPTPPAPGDAPRYKEAPKKDEPLKETPAPEPPKEPDPPKESAPAPVEEPPKPAITDLAQYRKFLAKSMPADLSDRTYVPKIRFVDNSERDNLEVMKYFGMELIAYPQDQSFYIAIDPERDLYTKSSEFDHLKSFSNRVIFRSSPWFDRLRKEAARRTGVSEESLSIAQLLKPASALYLAWKQNEAAKAAGCAIADVAGFEATFVKTPFGVWIARLDRFTTLDGRTVEVDDFEWRQVSAPKGGGR